VSGLPDKQANNGNPEFLCSMNRYEPPKTGKYQAKDQADNRGSRTIYQAV